MPNTPRRVLPLATTLLVIPDAVVFLRAARYSV
jgi:hypothetical protein